MVDRNKNPTKKNNKLKLFSAGSSFFFMFNERSMISFTLKVAAVLFEIYVFVYSKYLNINKTWYF